MKKIIFVLLIIAVLSLSACGKKATETQKDAPAATSVARVTNIFI
ncbi:hypothetical protein [Psychrobacillus sp. L4]